MNQVNQHEVEYRHLLRMKATYENEWNTRLCVEPSQGKLGKILKEMHYCTYLFIQFMLIDICFFNEVREDYNQFFSYLHKCMDYIDKGLTPPLYGNYKLDDLSLMR